MQGIPSTNNRCSVARRLAFESLEPRQMLSVSVDLVTRAAWPSSSAGGESGGIIISGNGRYVVFESDAPNLLPGLGSVPEESRNLFRLDRVTGDVVLVTANRFDQGYSNGYAFASQISDDGNVVLFRSHGSDLHPLDTDNVVDYYARTISAGVTQLVNVNRMGTDKILAYLSKQPLSDDGRFIVFESSSNELHPLDTNDQSDVFVRDLLTGYIELISVNAAGTVPANGPSGSAIISGDGNVVVFGSAASDIHPLDSNEGENMADMYARNRSTGMTQLVTIDSSGTSGIDEGVYDVSVGRDGRRILFMSYSNKIHDDDSDYTPDLFLRDLSTNATSWFGAGGGIFLKPKLSPDGSKVVTSGGTGGVFIVDVETRTSHDFGTGLAQAASVSSDGTVLVFDILENGSKRQMYVYRLGPSGPQLLNSATIGSGIGGSTSPAIAMSPDGSFVAITSLSTSFVAGDANGMQDIFAYDIATGNFDLLSAPAIGVQSATAGGTPFESNQVLSANGRYIAFTSNSTNLISGMTIDPRFRNVYRYDRLTKQIEFVSVNAVGTGPGNESSGDFGEFSEYGNIAISADGNVVAFVSNASDLHPLDTNHDADVFVRKFSTGTTELVSINRDGTASADDDSGGRIRISADGSRVMFFSRSRNLQELDTDRETNVFVRDLIEGKTTLVTVNATGTGGTNDHINEASMSDDGSVVAFMSNATNLHPLDTDYGEDVFARDISAGVTHLVSKNLNGTAGGNSFSYSPMVSGNGRVVAFLSTATDLHLLSANAPPGQIDDLYARDLVTGELHLVSVNVAGNGGANRDISQFDIDRAGSTIVFESTADNLQDADDDGDNGVELYDIFVRNLIDGTTALVSDDTSSLGPGPTAGSYSPSISADGNSVAFLSEYGNLDVLVKILTAGETQLVSHSIEGPFKANDASRDAQLSGDGSVVIFRSLASDLVPRDFNSSFDIFLATINASSLPGDYNRDRQVDAADYAVWRDALGETGLTPYSGADGNGDGTIDQSDYLVWKAYFGSRRAAEDASGQQSLSAAASTPPPAKRTLERPTVESSTRPRSARRIEQGSRPLLQSLARVREAGLLAWLASRSQVAPGRTLEPTATNSAAHETRDDAIGTKLLSPADMPRLR